MKTNYTPNQTRPEGGRIIPLWPGSSSLTCALGLELRAQQPARRRRIGTTFTRSHRSIVTDEAAAGF